MTDLYSLCSFNFRQNDIKTYFSSFLHTPRYICNVSWLKNDRFRIPMDTEKIIKTIIDAAYRVRAHFMPGYLESIYENALIVELEDLGLKVQSQKPLSVTYKNRIIGEFKIDLLVEDCVIIEIKSVNKIIPAHEMQLVNYLSITGINDGLVINFGNLEKLDIKRKYRIYKSK